MSIVYYTKKITPESLVKIFNSTGFFPVNPLVKISSGEPGKGPRYCLNPNLIGRLVNQIHGTIGETNVGYDSPRAKTETHWEVIKKHGYMDIAPCDILDSEDEIYIPVPNGKHLTQFHMGSHTLNYKSFLILSHFKGHGMAGYGGALKNIAIGMASSKGKRLVHSGGKMDDKIAGEETVNKRATNKEVQLTFLESMVDANAAFQEWTSKNELPVLYINVANNISIDCDSVAEPVSPELNDIGIFASFDPVALDKACIDFASKCEGSKHLMQRIYDRYGLHTLEYGEKRGLGSQKYEIVDIDATEADKPSLMESVNFSQIKSIVDNIPKEEHHLFYHGDVFKNSPYSVYRNAIFSSSDKAHGAFIEIYNMDKSHPNIGVVVIAATPDARGKGYTDKLIQDAIKQMPSLGIDTLYWKCSNDNDFSYQLALRNGFKLNKRYSSKERLLTYTIPTLQPKEDKFLYHGSPFKFNTLKVRDSGYSGKHAFATDNYAFALVYAGKQWSDFEINQSRVNGVMYLTEIISGKFKEIFDRPGYIHLVKSEYFKPFHGVEYISNQDVPVIKTIRVDNILEELKKDPNVKLFEYPNLPFFIPNREKYLRDMSKKYGNHDVVKIMNIIKSKD